MSQPFSEAVLERMEAARDPAAIPELIRTIREQQHALDRLRLGLEVARKDREELRMALLQARDELRRAKREGPAG